MVRYVDAERDTAFLCCRVNTPAHDESAEARQRAFAYILAAHPPIIVTRRARSALLGRGACACAVGKLTCSVLGLAHGEGRVVRAHHVERVAGEAQAAK